MLDRLSQKCADFLIAKGAARQEEREVFVYGFQISFSTLLSVFSILLISVIFANVFYGGVYLLFSFIIRLFCGGYHATTYLNCFLCTNGLFVGAFLIALYTPAGWMLPITVIVTILAGIYVFFNTPIENENHPLTEKKIQKNRRISRRLIVVQCLLILVGVLLFTGLAVYCYMACLATAVVAILMLVVKCQDMKKEVKA